MDTSCRRIQAMVRNFVHAELCSRSLADAQRQFAKWCVEVDGPSDNGVDKYQSGSDKIP